MEPVHARKVFPCFDEPRFKAQFQVTINRPIDFQPSIGNTKIEKNEITSIDGYVQLVLTNEIINLFYIFVFILILRKSYVSETFEITPYMSTYLVAFIVSEFECRRNKTFEVCSRPNAFEQTLYSFDVGQELLSKFEDLLKLPYLKVSGIGKMTLAALPDFNAGAMENWGS